MLSCSATAGLLFFFFVWLAVAVHSRVAARADTLCIRAWGKGTRLIWNRILPQNRPTIGRARPSSAAAGLTHSSGPGSGAVRSGARENAESCAVSGSCLLLPAVAASATVVRASRDRRATVAMRFQGPATVARRSQTQRAPGKTLRPSTTIRCPVSRRPRSTDSEWTAVFLEGKMPRQTRTRRTSSVGSPLLAWLVARASPQISCVRSYT